MSRAHKDVRPDPRLLAEREAIADELTRRLRRTSTYVPHRPHPRQAEFLALDCLEALYGGAAGGGKSDALLMAALQYVHVPGYSALILRRTYADLALPDAIMSRAHAWLSGTPARWSGETKTYTFPGGATLSFGYLETERDKYRYQGAQVQFVGFDELTQFLEAEYTYLFSRLRKREGVDVPLRMRAATNPGGIGHEWVKERFLDAENGPPFIPARLDDNPSVDQASYLESLSKLDSVTRKQLLEGVWMRDSGGLVYQHTNERNVIVEAPNDLQYYLLGIDYGYTDDCGFVVCGWRDNDQTIYIVLAETKHNMIPTRAATYAAELEARFGFVRMVGDTQGLGKGYAQEARERFHMPIEQAEKNNKRGYIALMNDGLKLGRIKVVRSACGALLDEWAKLPWNEDRSKEHPGFANHASDAALYAWRATVAHHERIPEQRPKPGTREALRLEEDEAEERIVRELQERSELAWWER